MQVDLVERADLVWGVDRVVREGAAARFRRMPEPLERHYADAEARGVRMRCTSGVRIVLRTDSRRLRMALEYGDAARPLYQVDLSVDGQPAGSFGPEDERPAPWEGEVVLGEERAAREVVVWLTHCAETRVAALEVDDGASVSAAPKPRKTWLAIGDSITQGMTCRTPSCTYAALAAARLGVGLRNVGVGGGRMERALGGLCRPIAAAAATVAFGVNDFNSAGGAGLFGENARLVLEGLLEGRPRFPVGLITPLPWAGRAAPNERGESLEDYRSALREAARGFPSVRVIEGTGLVPDDARFFVDGVHPNDRGMARCATGLAPHVAALLRL